ncbi:josephin-2 isoform X1 [Aythya fuligula]|uniref:Josephin-2 n=1 Tax=Aythya fuligula TaxID=219594 RepID=A0A6J3EGB4_AYTFU|nr:josephin-2 isoform X1 [Aythya fuligula]
MSGPPPAGGAEPGLYHERQRLELCAVHALNNVLQRPCFTQEAADDICKRLAPDARLNPHRSVLGTGNYDVNVIMAALQSLGLAAVWWDKRRSLERLVLGQIVGFILNVPSHVSLGFVALPLRRKHWLAVRQLGGTYYNLDSKLRAPARIGGEAELRYDRGRRGDTEGDTRCHLHLPPLPPAELFSGISSPKGSARFSLSSPGPWRRPAPGSAPSDSSWGQGRRVAPAPVASG